MHNKFKYFGFFGSSNSKDLKADDKAVKYLYKHDSNKIKDKSHKKKHRNRSSHDEDNRHKHKHKHQESSHEERLHSPEHRRKHKEEEHRSRDRGPDDLIKTRIKHEYVDCEQCSKEKKDSDKKYKDLSKLIKEHKVLREAIKGLESGDEEWLTKKELFKLLNNSKLILTDPSFNPGVLKKFFDIETRESVRDTIDKHLRHHKPSTDKAEKKKKDKIRSEELDKASSESDRRHRSRSNNGRKDIERSASAPPKKTHRRKRSVEDGEDFQGKDEQDMVKKHLESLKSSKKSHKKCEEIDNLKNVQEEIMKLVSAVQKVQGKSKNKTDRKSKSRSPSKMEVGVKSNSFLNKNYKAILDKQIINNVNTSHHSKCLVKKTFSVVEIPSTIPSPSSAIERKKKLKAFKKYYRYNNPDVEDCKTEIYSQAYSDCHKLYQDVSEQPEKKHHKVNRDKEVARSSEHKLKSETHVSTVVVNESKSSKTEEKKLDKKVSGQNSKIPILNSPGRMMMDKLRRNISSSKNKNEETTNKEAVSKVQSLKKETTVKNLKVKKEEKEKVQKLVKEKDSSGIQEKTSEPAKSKLVNNRKTVAPSSKIPQVNKSKETEVKKKPLNKPTDSTVNKKESKVSNLSTASKFSKQSKQSVKDTKNLSSSPPSSHNTGSSLNNKKRKKSNKSSMESKSDTKLSQNQKTATADKKYKTFQRSSTKASFSNSTFGDKSTDSSFKNTSFFLTKSYRDDDKLNRWYKSKMYADTVRRNLINKSQNKTHQASPAIAPQVMEVRYLTVTQGDVAPEESVEANKATDVSDVTPQGSVENSTMTDLQLVPKLNEKEEATRKNDPSADVKSELDEEEEIEEIERIEEETILEFFIDDLPQPCADFFQLPIDEALNEIMKENYKFLQKDFSYNIDIVEHASASSSSSDVTPCEKKFQNDWEDDDDDHSFSDSCCCCHKLSDFGDETELTLKTKRGIIDSCSAPSSEESGYATNDSSRMSSNFFERPEIKALFHPPYTGAQNSYLFEVQLDTKSTASLEIHSIESKSLQTVIECSQKSVQIKLSQEMFPEVINFSEERESEHRTNISSVFEDASCDSDESKNEESNELEQEQEVAEETCSAQESRASLNIDGGDKKEKHSKKQRFFMSCITCISGK